MIGRADYHGPFTSLRRLKKACNNYIHWMKWRWYEIKLNVNYFFEIWHGSVRV